MNSVLFIVFICLMVVSSVPAAYVLFLTLFGKEIARFAIKRTTKGEHILHIDEAGYYAIWITKKSWTFTNPNNFPLVIYNHWHIPMTTHRSFLGGQVNSLSRSSRVWRYIKLDAGDYKIEIGGERQSKDNDAYYVIKKYIPEHWLLGLFALQILLAIFIVEVMSN